MIQAIRLNLVTPLKEFLNYKPNRCKLKHNWSINLLGGNRNLQIFKALLKAKRMGSSLLTSAASEPQRGAQISMYSGGPSPDARETRSATIKKSDLQADRTI